MHKSYRTRSGVSLKALDGVTLTITPASTVALTAPSGAGKSTLLHIMGAMDAPDSGTVTVGGQDITALGSKALTAYRRRVGFVFQRFHLLPGLSALDNVLAPVLPYGLSKATRGRARELLGAVGLSGRTDALPSSLSGGEQQRVAIARALINRPVLLLADEPTGNLDSQTGNQILDLIFHLHEDLRFTAIVATHDSAIATACDRRIGLLDGRVVSDDTDA